MATRSRSRRSSLRRKRPPVRGVERLWSRLTDLFVARDAHTLATAVVLAPRRLEPRRMLDAGAGGLALELLQGSDFVQTGQDYAALNDAASSAPAYSAASESTMPGEPQAVMGNTPPSNIVFAPIVAVDEGGVATLQLAFDDPDAGDSHTVEVDWGDGTPLEVFNVPNGSQFLGTTHQYLDDPAGAGTEDFTVNFRVIDFAGDFATATTTATVHNLAPKNLVIAPPAAINENGVGQLALSFDDDGTLDTHTVEVDWGDGTPLETFNVAPGSHFLSTTHQYLDDNAADSYTINVRVIDDDGGDVLGSQNIAVSNVAPTASVIPPPAILENGFASLSVALNDPGTLDAHQVEIDWGDGSAVQFVSVPAGQQFVTTIHQYLDDNPTGTSFDSYAIKVRVHDDDAGVTPVVQTSVKVTNLAPSNVLLDPVAAIDENQFATLNVAFEDPGTLDVHQVEVDWGDGSAVEVLSLTVGSRFLSTTHQYLDDNPTATSSDKYTISVRVLDDDGGSSAPPVTTVVTVNNVAPSNLLFLPPADIDENGVATLTLGFDDPGSLDSHTVEVDWGDGSPVESFNLAAGALVLSTTHQYLDDNSTNTASDVYAIKVKVLDDDGGQTLGQTSVTVNNVAPSNVQLAPIVTIDENDFATLNLTFDDPGSLDTHKVEINWGDGSAVETLTVSAGARFFSTTHQYLDDNPTATAQDNYTVSVRVLDDDTGISSPATTAMVTVKNVAPSNVQIGPLAAIDENGVASLNVTFDDPGSLDTHKVEVNWGDGSAVETLTVTAGSRFLSTTHQYLDDNPTGTAQDNYTVSVRVLDDDTGMSSPATTATLTVKNVAPSNVQIGPLATIDENGVASLNVTFDDPGTLDTHKVEVNWGDGSAVETLTVTAGSRFLSTTHQYLDDNPTGTAQDNYTASVRVLDDDTGISSPVTTATITVKNVAPSNVQIGPLATIDENGVASLNVTFDDPGTLDTHKVEVNWGDGSAVETLTVTAGSRFLSTTHQYLDDNPTGTAQDNYTVSVRVLDDDGGISSPATTATVTVKNVAPSNVQIAPMATINENDFATLNVTFDDPGSLDTHQVEINWGDGSAVETLTVTAGARFFSTTHQYLDDNPTGTSSDVYTVSVRVLDDDTGASSPATTATVTVNNVVPSGVVVAPVATINENDFATLNLTFTDPGTLDTHQVEVDWGDGSAVETLTVTAGSRAFSTTHQYLDDNPTGTSQDNYTIKVRLLDDDGGISSPQATAVVTVKNVAPFNVAVIPAANTVAEGSQLDLTFTFDDPGSQDTHTYQVDWGDGKFTTGAAVRHGFAASHTYADNGNYAVKVTVTDDDGGVGVGMGTVAVSNVAPTLNVAGNQTVNEGSLLSLTDIGTFTDPGFDNPDNAGNVANGGETQETFTFTVDWGDGTTADAGAATVDQIGSVGVTTKGSFNASHTFADNGTYTVTVTVVDDDMGSVSKTFTVTVNNVDPVLTGTANHVLNEGEIFTMTSLGVGVSDPGFDNPANAAHPENGGEVAETFEVMQIDWGDGTTTTPVNVVNRTSGSVGTPTTAMFDHVGHAYADNGNYTVTVTLRDDDGGFVNRQFTIIVNNVDPTLTGITDLSVDEGKAFTLDQIGVGLTDPGFDNPANAGNVANGGETQETFTSFSIDWGDGTAATPVSIVKRVSGSIGTATTADFMHDAHTYADNGVYTVKITVQDDDGAVVTRELTITVLNVDPSLTGTANHVVNESQTFTLEGLGVGLTDPGFDNPLNAGNVANGGETQETFTGVSIDWGDGTATTPVTVVNRVSGSVGVPTTARFNHDAHTYADNGVYTVTVRVQDDDGAVVARQFTITVKNLPPVLNQFPNGKKLEGDDITPQGTTIVRMSLHDPGYDNSSNQPNVTNGGESYETFTYIVDWGDGSVDAVHSYATTPTGPVTVSVNGGPAAAFAANGDVNRVLTLASKQVGLYDASVPTTAYTFEVNWGDGTVDTLTLFLKSPTLPGSAGFPTSGSTGQTLVVAAPRDSGSATVETTSSAQLQHTYLAPPDPLHPANDVPIRLTVLDDDGGTDGGLNDPNALILIPNPGVTDKLIRIDTSPKVPTLTFPVRMVSAVTINATQAAIDSDNDVEEGGSAGEAKVTGERYLELDVINPDLSIGGKFRLPPEVLSNLPALFRNLPDGHYAIYLVQAETQVKRLVMEVFVRDGRMIDPGDDSEGARDRPPSDDANKAQPGAAEGNGAAGNGEAAAGAKADAAQIESAIRAIETAPAPNTGGSIGLPAFDPSDGVPAETAYPATVAALRHGSMLASVSLALSSAGRSWRTQVDETLAKAQKEQRKALKSVGHWRGKKPR